MAYRELELTLLSARDLKNVNLITRMDVYAVATISGDPLTRQCTAPDPHGGRHPCWNATLRFNVPPTAAAAAGACLHVLLRAERVLGDRDVGEVVVPLADLLAAAAPAGPTPPQLASYPVRKVHRWEPRGVLNVSYRLGPVVAPVGVDQQQPPSRPAAHAYPPPPPPPPRPAAKHEEAPAPAPPPTNSKSNGRGPAGPSQVCVGPHTQIILGAPTGPGTMVSPPAGFSVSPGKPKQQDTQVVRGAHATAKSMPTISPRKEDRSRPKMSSQNDMGSGFGSGNGNLSAHQHGSSTHSLSPPSSPYPNYPFTPSPCSSAHSSTHSPYSSAHTSTPSPRPLGRQDTSNSFGARATSHTDSPRSTSTRGTPASSPFPSSLVVAK
ncbi:hypothetical protein BS78_06G017500 [Paspalum vaginatum]|nr:hypothetical protein BS78_06G017500 [Paspalum vaginatum]